MGAPLSISQAAITALLQGLQHAAVAGRVVSGGVCREVWPRVRGKRQLTGCHCDAHQAAAMVCFHAVLMLTRVPGAGCNAWPLPQMHASQGYGTFWLCRLACAQHVNGSAMVQVCCEWPGGGWRWCSSGAAVLAGPGSGAPRRIRMQGRGAPLWQPACRGARDRCEQPLLGRSQREAVLGGQQTFFLRACVCQCCAILCYGRIRPLWALLACASVHLSLFSSCVWAVCWHVSAA